MKLDAIRGAVQRNAGADRMITVISEQTVPTL